MKRNVIICTFAMTALLLSGCARNNAQGAETPSASDSATHSASADAAQSTTHPQANTVQNSGEETNMISEEEARQIALDQVPGATAQDIREFESGYDNGRLEYEGKIHYEQKEYEFEIDGYSGDILKWDVEPINDGTS